MDPVLTPLFLEELNLPPSFLPLETDFVLTEGKLSTLLRLFPFLC
jgi:hypothetical protein